MKKNAQKILLLLFSLVKNDQVLLTPHQLRMACPDMSEGGFRSLLLFLERKGWLIKETLPSKQYYSITEAGREALKAKFPALNDSWDQWNGEWHALVCIKAPNSDPQFRYLRKLLISHHGLPLSRGVYLAAGSFNPEVIQVCKKLYHDSVVIFSVQKWEFGVDRPIVVNYYDLAGIASVYSGISDSIDSLLVIFNSKKSFTDQQKLTISTTIDRLWSGLRDDPGFTSYYFPGLLDIASILDKLRAVL